MKNPFFGPGARRAIEEEISSAIEEFTGCTPVYGFAEMLDAGESLENTGRISGFCEQGARREWLLRLDAKKGMAWKSAPVPVNCTSHVAFVLNIGFGNGSPLPQPTGAWQISVQGRPAIRIRDVNHSQLWRGACCDFAFAANRMESAPPYGSLCLSSILTEESWAVFGPALLKVPASWLEPGKAATLNIEPVCDVPSSRWVQLGPCARILQSTDIWAVVELLREDSHPRIGNYQAYFGDIHTHSGQLLEECNPRACGMGSRRENYEYAREPSALDFYALTDHEYQIDPARCDEYLGLADSYNEDGRFVCLPGYEFTNALYGHRNVYFRESGGTVFSANPTWESPSLDPAKCSTTQDLWTAMEQTGVPFLTIPHHSSATSHPMNLDFYDPRYDRLFEVYSSWGSSEYYGDFPRGVSDRFQMNDYRDALRRGQRYGVIASSDGHDGHPGYAQSPWIKHHHIFHFCGSGRAVALSHELTRAAIFDALYTRRCYATTGVPILLDVTVCGTVMGTELPTLQARKRPEIAIRCTGVGPLDHLRIMKNDRIVHTIPCHGQRSVTAEWVDVDYKPELPVCYYARVVQMDRESAWSSPVWIGNNGSG